MPSSSSPSPADLVAQLSAAAEAEGFVMSGVAPAVDSAGHTNLVRWIESGYAAGMQYVANRIDAYRHPSGVLPGAKSLLVLAYPYANRSPVSQSPVNDDSTTTSTADQASDIPISTTPASTTPASTTPAGHGRLARYTWAGTDYHDVIHPKLKRLCRLIRDSFPDANARGVVDTAPLMEREVAQLAGLGWRGKNTLLLNKHLGSYFFLACVLVDIELPIDQPHESAHCGTCTACLDACPTNAFPSAGVLDASRCISYLTIEHDGPIDPSLRDGIGDWVFGCDICQEVCPWNRKSARHVSVQTDATMETLELSQLFFMNDDDFRARFRKTPMWRTRRRGLLRNAAIVLGNTAATADHLNALSVGSRDSDAAVRDSCNWALRKIRHRKTPKE